MIFISMKNLIKQLLRENLQLADKFYFKDGKLSPRVREIILHITNGDPYTKIMTDIYYAMLMNGHRTGNWALKQIDPEHQETENPENDVMSTPELQKLRPLYNQLKEYNKNVFPIKGFNINGVEDVNDFIWALKQRQLILDVFKTLPSIASRNMKSDIRLERDGSQMNHYRDELVSVHAYLLALTNRDEETQRKILGKIFKKDTSLENVYDFVIDKQNLIGGVDITRKQIGQILKKDREEYDELKVKYNKDNIMVIEVTGPNGIKEIGCNSLWCFTYNSKGGGVNWNDWYNNSTYGYCYIIIDFSEPSDSPNFMYVLTKPMSEYDNSGDDDDYSNGGHMLFDMSNEEIEDPINTIENMIDYPTAIRVMNFGVKPPKEKKKKFVDPNQLALDLHENKIIIKNSLRKSLINEVRVINPNNSYNRGTFTSMENEPPLHDNETIRVYHGFNKYDDAVMAAKFGFSGEEKARRIYSYESNNNPNGLFVTLDYKTAEKFAYPSGSRGIKVVLELSVKVANLEAPVWPGGTYTVQGQMSQYWKDAEDRNINGTLKAREEASQSKIPFVRDSDRPEVANALLDYERQALFIGNINPNMIKSVFFGESGKHGYNPKTMERISRQEFLNKFETHEPEQNSDGRLTDKGEQYNKRKDRIFKPNDNFNMEIFNKECIENEWDKTGIEMLKNLQKYRYLDNIFWPKQIKQINDLLENYE